MSFFPDLSPLTNKINEINTSLVLLPFNIRTVK